MKWAAIPSKIQALRFNKTVVDWQDDALSPLDYHGFPSDVFYKT